MIFPRDRMNNYRLAYEDSDGFGNNFQEDSIGAGITSLPIRQPQPVEQPQPIYQPIVQPVAQPAAQPMPLETDYYAQQFRDDFTPQPIEPAPQPILETPQIGVAAPALQPESAPIGAQPLAQPQADQNTGVFGLPITPDQAPEQAQPAQPAQPAGPDPKTIDLLANQILGQGLTSKWSGQGLGSAEANARDMAKIMADIGITDIRQFGPISRQVEQYVGSDDSGNPIYETQTENTFGNKETGQAVPLTYSGRQTGNFFGGTFEGKGNTGYGVQFGPDGTPYFYTQGASSNDLANLIQDMGPLGQIGLAVATGGLSLPAQLATNAGIQLLAGGNLGDIAKGTALSYLGGQAGNLISGSSGITDLLGKTGSDIAARTAQQFVGSGGKADLEQALLGNVLSSGVNSVIGELPGLDNLSPVDKNMTSNLITAIATGTPIDQAIQNALVGKASSEARSAVAEARNAAPAPQTYEEMMAGIMPKTPDQPSTDTGPSNDEILKQIGYEPEPTTVQQEPANLDQLLRSLQPYAEPTLEGRTLPQERTQITQDPSEAQVSFNIDDLLKQLPTDNEKPPVDNLINQAVTDTLGTKNADEPATGKGKTMDEIDYSQIPGDFGGNIADLIANAGSSGNASSIFSGDGGIDLSALASNAGDEDQAAPPPGTADLLKGIIYTDTGDPTSMMEKYYKRGITYDLDESNLGNLSPEELERYNRMKSGDTSQYDEMAEYLRARPQDFGGADVTQYLDEFNKNFNPAGGFGSGYQTVGTNRVMIHDDGTATVIDPTTKESSYLDEDQVKALVKNGTLNSSKSGYVASTGGKGTTPGGGKAVTPKAATKPAAKPGTSPGTNNNNMIMALIAMMAMMNSRGGGKSSAASVIPALSANRSQLPYGPSSGAPAARPGAGGVNYFTPMSYTPKAAGGGLMSLAGGGMSNLGGYSDGGRLLRGPGDGVSDSIPATIGGKQPARLATGEFVVPARIVSELGNGSTEAGANKLYAMMDRVQKARRKTKNVAADTKAHKYLPA